MNPKMQFLVATGKVIRLHVFGAGPNSAMIEFTLGPIQTVNPFVVLADPTGPEPDTGTMPQVFSAMAAMLSTALSSRLDVEIQYVQVNGQNICRSVTLG